LDLEYVMLLALAPAEDELTERFLAYARARGVRCARWPEDRDSIRACTKLDDNGAIEVSIYGDRAGTRVRAVLNRGVHLAVAPASEDDGFRHSETLAAWWSALAFFTGPVVNRPAHEGFTPNVDPVSLVRATRVVDMAPTHLVSRSMCGLEAPRVNVHRVRDARFLGTRADLSDASILDEEACALTGFDPERTRHIVVAGSRAFQIAGPGAPAECPSLLGPLVSEVRRRHATLSLLVVDHAEEKPRLVHATALPTAGQIRVMEAEIQRSLLEYLTS
jgi:hypothetical protein